MTEFAGRTVVVTGASRGIGSAIAKRFLREGANVVANVRDVEHGHDFDPDPRLRLFKADVRDDDALRGLMRAAVDSFGGIDVLVNNAGVDEPCALLDITREHLDRIWSVNVTALILASRFAAEEMVRREKGVILNIASIAGKEGSPLHTAYVSSKHAVIGATRCAARELIPYNIRVNAICPGLIDTDMPRGYYSAVARMTGGDLEDHLRASAERSLSRRAGTADDVAALTVFLASDGAANIIGQAVNTDGGALDH